MCRSWLGAICLQEAQALRGPLAPGVPSRTQPTDPQLPTFYFLKEAKKGAVSENKKKMVCKLTG